MSIVRFIRELRRRRVFRLAGIYLIGAWLVLQIADVTLGPLGFPAWSMTALVWVVVLGFPIALLLSWRFDITERGLVRITSSGRADPTDLSLQPSDYGILAGLLVVAAFVAYSVVDYTRQTRVDSPLVEDTRIRDNAVAVLPFDSDNAEHEYFADGISEEILNSLAQVDALEVIARTSSFAFRDREADIREIARSLRAGKIVDGSVRRAGNRLRITAQLVDATSGILLWSEAYDRQLGDVLVVQQDIADNIVAALRDSLGVIVGPPRNMAATTDSVQAYDRYLLGNHYYQQRGKEAVEKAIELFVEAVNLDPEFAAAWAALAAAYNSAGAHGADVGEGDPFALAEAAAERAIELDDSQGAAYMVLGNVRGYQRRDFESGVRYLRKAIQASPNNPTVLHWMAEAMWSVGKLKSALDYAQKVYELDPSSPLRSMFLGCINMANGRFAQAEQYLQQARSRGYRDRYSWRCEVMASLESGDYAAAASRMADKPFESDETLSVVEDAVIAARREPSAANVRNVVDRVIDAYAGDEGGQKIGGDLALYYLASVGAIDAAYELVDLRIQRGARIELTFVWLPSHSAFRRDPRFGAILERENLPVAWDQLGWPPNCRRHGATVVCD